MHQRFLEGHTFMCCKKLRYLMENRAFHYKQAPIYLHRNKKKMTQMVIRSSLEESSLNLSEQDHEWEEEDPQKDEKRRMMSSHENDDLSTNPITEEPHLSAIVSIYEEEEEEEEKSPSVRKEELENSDHESMTIDSDETTTTYPSLQETDELTQPPTWIQVVRKAIIKLKEERGQLAFHVSHDICPYIHQHWDKLFGEKPRTLTWQRTVSSTLTTHPNVFLKLETGIYMLQDHADALTTQQYPHPVVVQKRTTNRRCSIPPSRFIAMSSSSSIIEEKTGIRILIRAGTDHQGRRVYLDHHVIFMLRKALDNSYEGLQCVNKKPKQLRRVQDDEADWESSCINTSLLSSCKICDQIRERQAHRSGWTSTIERRFPSFVYGHIYISTTETLTTSLSRSKRRKRASISSVLENHFLLEDDFHSAYRRQPNKIHPSQIIDTTTVPLMIDIPIPTFRPLQEGGKKRSSCDNSLIQDRVHQDDDLSLLVIAKNGSIESELDDDDDDDDVLSHPLDVLENVNVFHNVQLTMSPSIHKKTIKLKKKLRIDGVLKTRFRGSSSSQELPDTIYKHWHHIYERLERMNYDYYTAHE
jgi:hypothetical protein